MVKYEDPALDAVFAALADSTRRGILESLSSGGAHGPGVAVSELAAPHDMSLPGFMKHLKVLEDAGLVTRIAAEFGDGDEVFVYFNNDPGAAAIADATVFGRTAQRIGRAISRIPMVD
jgi:DNA-binding transcriptional ArsR family regulator